MFNVYAVRMNGAEKERYFIGSYESLDFAKHHANCAVCGNADYSYVKDKGTTIFYLRPPYDPHPDLSSYIEDPSRPLRLRSLQAYPEPSRVRKDRAEPKPD